MVWVAAALTILAVLIALPGLVLFAQCVIAALPLKDRSARAKPARPTVGVLVPAHNEETVIGSTLDSIRLQLAAGDRLLVIADNCADATARIANECGAEVLERSDPTRRGKGYALQSGVERFRADPPAIVIVIDADCRLRPGCLDALAAQVAQTSRPAQACYLMTPPPAPRAIDVVSSLAVLVKNRVRPLAMAKLGLPCLITGSGSAFPWQAIQLRSFGGGNIVEDMQLAVDLALAGFSPTFCDRAVVLAGLPARHSAFVSQRRRWEHGHLQTLLAQAPRLLVGFFKTGRLDLAAMMADLAVPPLSLLAAMNAAMLAVTFIWGIGTATWTPAAIAGGTAVLLSASIAIAWWRFARDRVPFHILLTVPVYVVTKLPLYATFLFRRERAWIRTGRASSPEIPKLDGR
jgi:cellulose synthase/poly-beta-1,6-N-acetylglucosamine synthase-like glycosyltransferase